MRSRYSLLLALLLLWLLLPGTAALGATLATGDGHSCAIASGGTVQCWGYNVYGQLGNNSITDSHVPVAVSSLSGAIAVTAGNYHSCALLSAGTMKCWGNNGYGQLGINSTTDSHVPVVVSGLSGVITIAAGLGHTCALQSSGTMQCWGHDFYGQLGNNTASTQVPAAVLGLSGATAITGGASHSCALLSGGTVQCWGLNSNGQLGNNSTTQSLVPVAVSGLSGVTAITAGLSHTCALLSGGTVQCWGGNASGQLGNNSTTDSHLPAAVLDASGVTALGGVTAIAAGAAGSHTCALLSDGTMQCWGNNDYGQLGNNSTTQSPVPVAVTGLSGVVTAITAGFRHTCAVLSGGTVQCWGNNIDGELGNHSTTESHVPVTVTGLSGVATAVVGGGSHTCALLSGGTAQCWGVNVVGELGNGSLTTSTVPVTVLGLSGATALVAGFSHACALLSGGTLQCWGGNSYGQLGDNTVTSMSSPDAVSGLSGATAFAGGGDHTCAVLSAGTAKCWGNNYNGQIGDGDAIDYLAPQPVSGTTFTVPIATTTTISTINPPSSIVGQSYVVSFSVGAASGTPSGTVSVSDDQGASCLAVTLTSGSGSCSLASTVAGSRTLTASYTPDGRTLFGASSGTASQPVSKADTTLPVPFFAAEPSSPGAVTVQVSAPVPTAPGAGTPTGMITLSATGASGCVITLPGSSCSMTFANPGAYTVTALYSGDSGFNTSTSNVMHSVAAFTTTTTITSVVPSTPFVGETVQVNYAVSGGQSPTGTVTVSVNGGETCTATVAAGQCNLSFALSGAHTLTAAYAGDTNNNGSTSSPTSLTVNSVNQNPNVSTPSAQTFPENTVSSAIAITIGDVETPATALTLVATSSDQTRITDASLASGLSGTGANRSLMITPVTDANGGPVTITLTVTDLDGGSATTTFPVTITLVNHPPSFTLQGNQIWLAGAVGLKTLSGFAQVTSFGPPNESGQQVQAWLVSVSSDTSGVLSGVQIQNDGTLSYTLTGQSGTATVSVELQDNGGTANGGNDTSTAQTFQISVGVGLDLAISITDGTDFLSGGSLVDYTITVKNIGTTDAHNAIVQDILPSNLLGASWTCSATGTATCTASGSGNITDTVNIAKNAAVTYSLSATVQALPEFPVVHTATVSAAGAETDINSSNNSATDTDTVGIFANGFEAQVATPRQLIQIATDGAKTAVVALDKTLWDSAEPGAQPRLIALMVNPAGSAEVALHVRQNKGWRELRLSVKGDDGIWQTGSWRKLDETSNLLLGWTSSLGKSGEILLIEVEIAADFGTVEILDIPLR